MKKRAFNEYSYLGGMATSRLGVDGTYNLSYGVDGVIRVFGDDYLTVRLAQTLQDSAENNPLSMDPTSITLDWERRKQEGLSYSAGLTYSGTDFNPGIGFEMIDDFIATASNLEYTWISPEEFWSQSHSIKLFNDAFFRLRSYELNDVQPESQPGDSTSKNNWMGSVGARLLKSRSAGRRF